MTLSRLNLKPRSQSLESNDDYASVILSGGLKI
jgi:hypothetical protein